MDRINRDLRHYAEDLRLLDEEDQVLHLSSAASVDKLSLLKADVVSELSGVQSEISTLLSRLRALQQKEASLKADLLDLDARIDDESSVLELRSSSLALQVCIKVILLTFSLPDSTIYCALESAQ